MVRRGVLLAAAVWATTSALSDGNLEEIKGRRRSYVFHGIIPYDVDDHQHTARRTRPRRRRPRALDSLVFRKRQLRLPGKKGACYTLKDKGQEGSWVEHLPLIKYLRPYWNCSWGNRRIAAQPASIEFVPMIWGAWSAEQLQAKIVNDIVPDYQAGWTKRLLGFNEPDNVNQANMPYTKAIEYWPILESAGMPLASPAPVHHDSAWMTDFLAAAEAAHLRIDYLAVHWYGGVQPKAFKRQLKQIYRNNGKRQKLLLTEFAPADWQATSTSDNRFTRAEVLAFMKDVLPWLERQGWIAGYAWFPFRADFGPGACSALFESNGTPTALGRYYASVRKNRPDGDPTIQV